MIHYEYEMLKSIALSVSISSCRPRPTPSQCKANAQKLPLQCLPSHSKQHSKRHNIFSCHYQRCIEYHHTICYPFLPYNIKLTLATTYHDITIPHSMQHNIKLPQTTIWQYHTVWITIWNYHRPQYDNTTQYAAQYQVSCRPLLRLISSSLPPSPPISHQATIQNIQIQNVRIQICTFWKLHPDPEYHRSHCCFLAMLELVQ